MWLKEIEIDEKVLLIRINQLYHEHIGDIGLYEATRGVWKIGEKRNRVELAFAIYKGQIKEVYKIIKWHKAGTLKYQTQTHRQVNIPGRWEFEGVVAEPRIREKYLNKGVAHYFKQGASNPIMYINC